jgi:hypothetical protein
MKAAQTQTRAAAHSKHHGNGISNDTALRLTPHEKHAVGQQNKATGRVGTRKQAAARTSSRG